MARETLGKAMSDAALRRKLSEPVKYRGARTTHQIVVPRDSTEFEVEATSPLDAAIKAAGKYSVKCKDEPEWPVTILVGGEAYEVWAEDVSYTARKLDAQ